MKQLFIRPLDTQFYRSGLPFDAGHDSEVTSIFPPFPRTLYGAIRTQGLAATGVLNDINRWPSEYGTPTEHGSLSVKGPIIARLRGDSFMNSLFLPFPSDLVMQKADELLRFITPVDPASNTQGWSGASNPVPLTLLGQTGLDEVEGLADEFFLPFGFLVRYLTGALRNIRKRNLADGLKKSLVVNEERIGISRDRVSKTATTGMLYKVSHSRFVDKKEKTGFWMAVEKHADDFPSQGILQLGGESRAAAFQTLPEDTNKWWEIARQQVIDQIAATGRFKAYLVTPALFQKGWLPDVCDNIGMLPLSANGRNVPFQLTGFCCGRPPMVGGWDIQKKAPKPIKKAIPQGSVFFFKETGWENLDAVDRRAMVETLFNKYNFESWCTGDSEKEGFGISLIGGW